MRLPQLTFGRVLAGTAVVLVLTTGTAYAANTVGSSDIINGEVKTQDIANDAVTGSKIEASAVGSSHIASNAVKSADILNDSIKTADILNGTLTSADVATDTLTADDLASNSVGQLEIQTDGVAATEIADNTIDSGEIVDFQLSNQDISVLTAEVSAAGVLDNQCPGCGVSVIKLNVGQYEVDFSRTITACTFVATVGPSGGGSAAGEINVADRGGNAEAVFVDTNDSAGTSADRPFRLVVVC